MNVKDFLSKFSGWFLWGNLLAMALVVVLLMVGVKYGLDSYTKHGEGIKVPKVEGLKYAVAMRMLDEQGLRVMISDSAYNKQLPADCILAQNPGAGTMVKEGHIIYVSVNTASSPSFPIPDIVDNSSFREAEAKLTAMGFTLTPPQETSGEKDWVYGILCRGRRVAAGDRVSIESPLTLIIGSGTYDSEGDIDYVEPEYRMMQGDDIDDLEELAE